MLYNILIFIISIVSAICIFKIIYKDKFDINNKFIILEITFLIIGFLVRLLSIQYIPNGLNVDEASAGYEGFSILNYGIDRHGNHFPVFLESWGGGQNALLSYLMIPFIKLFGLSVLAIRLPMAIIGCISLVLWFGILRKISNEKIARIGLIFFAICPWHIMKSRWGLESNLFPDIILLFSFILIIALQQKNKFLFYLSFAVAGLSAYAYGTSYFFLPIFIIGLMIVLLRKKEIKIVDAILGTLIVGIVSAPIIICVIINKFDLNQINLPFMTIPKLNIMRYENISSIFSGNFLINSINNFIDSVKIVVNQNDNLPWNALDISGITYKTSLIFTIIGIFVSFKNKEKIRYNYIFNIWLIVSILLMVVCDPNINRINIVWIPIIYYTILGISYIVTKIKDIESIIFISYIILFMIFMYEYFNQDYSEYFTFNTSMEQTINYINEINSDNKNVYISNSIKEPYIYCLFYNKYDTNNFIETVRYKDDTQSEFQTVLSFGNYYFEKINSIEKNNIYIIKEDNLKEYEIDENIWNIVKVKDYEVIYEK